MMKIELDGCEVKVGDKLWSTLYGWGYVKRITEDIRYPLIMDFNTGEEGYTADGRYYYDTDVPRSLFWDVVEIIPPKPKQKVKRWRWVFSCKEDGAEHVSKPMSKNEFESLIERFGDKPIGRIAETEEEVWI